MNTWVKIGGWAVLALVLLWVVFQVISIIFGIVSWIVSMLVSLLVLALLLGLAYIAIRALLGRGGSSSTTATGTEREKIFE